MKLIGATIAGIFLHGFAYAETGELTPLISEDIRGFEIGMSAEGAMKIIESDFSEANIRTEEMRYRNTREEFLHTVKVINGEEEIRLNFTGSYSGSKLYGIHRHVRFPQGSRPSGDETIAAFRDKYGEPNADFGSTFYYMIDAPENRDLEPVRRPSICYKSVENVLKPLKFHPVNSEAPVAQNCGAVVEVKIGLLEGLVASLHVRAADYILVTDAAELDKAQDIRPVEGVGASVPSL